MSDMSVIHTMKRIEGATADSKIAVFKSSKPGCVNAVFAATVLTRRKIAAGDPLFIGEFDKTMDPARIRKKLDEIVYANLPALG